MNALVTKIESLNGGALWTVTLKLNGIDPLMIDWSKIAGKPDAASEGSLASGKHWFNFYRQPKINVGDQITENDEVIAAQEAGAVTEVEMTRKEPTLEEVWCEKHGHNINL